MVAPQALHEHLVEVIGEVHVQDLARLAVDGSARPSAQHVAPLGVVLQGLVLDRLRLEEACAACSGSLWRPCLAMFRQLDRLRLAMFLDRLRLAMFRQLVAALSAERGGVCAVETPLGSGSCRRRRGRRPSRWNCRGQWRRPRERPLISAVGIAGRLAKDGLEGRGNEAPPRGGGRPMAAAQRAGSTRSVRGIEF